MTSKEKYKAIAALTHGWECSIRLDVGDQFYLNWGGEIGGDGILRGSTGRGDTPEAAIEATWDILTKLPSDKYIVIDAMGEKRRHYRWEGYMWQELPVLRAVAQ